MEQAAAGAGVAATAWAAWEAGEAAPVGSAAELGAVCRVLLVDAAWLLGVSDRRGQPITGTTGWSTMTGLASARLAPGQPVPKEPAIRLGQVRLRRGGIEIAWRLRPGDDPAQVRDVWVEPADPRLGVAAEVRVQPTSHPPAFGSRQGAPVPGGVFGLPLPAFDPPWTVRGLGPGGPWREEQRADATVIGHYRRAAPAPEPRPAADHAGVCFRLDRVACLADRLAVFYELDAPAAGDDVHPSHPHLLRNGERPDPHHGVPAGPAELPQVRAEVAYFSLPAPGSEVEVAFPGVHWSEWVPCDVRLPIPPDVPAEVGPLPGLPPEYGVTAVYWSGGLLLDVRGRELDGLVTTVLETEGGGPVRLRGASGGGGRSVVVTEALPQGAQAVFVRALHVRRHLPGPWVLSFRVPDIG